MREKILIVDDDQAILRAFKRNLRDFNVLVTNSSVSALEILKTEDIDIIITDYSMPGMDGLQFLKILHNLHSDCFKIMLTGNADLNLAMSAVNEGEVYKFLIKPVNMIDLTCLLDEIVEKVRARKREQELFSESLWNATHDTLTGLANRVLLYENGRRAVEAWKRHGTGFAVIYIDLDKFKPINDTFGHKAGDEVLVQFSKKLELSTRSVDTVARIGGDEFVVLVDCINTMSEITTVIEKIRDVVAQPFKVDDNNLVIGASLGVTMCPRDGTDWDTLLQRADTCMYRAKKYSDKKVIIYSVDN